MNIRALAGNAWDTAVQRCPKRMAHGPCAGVHADGACEAPGAGRCLYLDVPDRDWPYHDTRIPAPRGPLPGTVPRLPAAAAFLATAAARPVVVADLVAPPLSADGIRVALEGEIAACADAGAAGVHCVTGDHPAAGHRPDAAAVFDLDSVGLIELARSSGALCSVAHAPAAPPPGKRLPRLIAKVNAGAEVVFVDHCGGERQLADAAAALRGAGFRGVLLCCVPVVTSAGAAEVIASFAAGRLPPGYLDTIMSAPDLAESGVAAAVRLAHAALDLPGVDGVNLSSAAEPGNEVTAARALAEVTRRTLGASARPRPATGRTSRRRPT